MIRSRIPLISSLAAMLLAVQLPSAATAAMPSPSVEFTKAPAAGDAVAGDVELSVKATSSNPLGSFSLTFWGDGTEPPFKLTPPHGIPSSKEPPKSNEITGVWHTNELWQYRGQRARTHLVNGVYRIVATARSVGDGDAPGSAVVEDLKLDNPPSTPTGLTAQVQKDHVRVVWCPEVHYLDLLGFVLERSAGEGPFEPVASDASEASGTPDASSADGGLSLKPDATFFEDHEAPRGKKLVYRLTSVRQSVVRANGIRSHGAVSAPLTSDSAAVAEAPRDADCHGEDGGHSTDIRPLFNERWNPPAPSPRPSRVVQPAPTGTEPSASSPPASPNAPGTGGISGQGNGPSNGDSAPRGGTRVPAVDGPRKEAPGREGLSAPREPAPGDAVPPVADPSVEASRAAPDDTVPLAERRRDSGWPVATWIVAGALLAVVLMLAALWVRRRRLPR